MYEHCITVVLLTNDQLVVERTGFEPVIVDFQVGPRMGFFHSTPTMKLVPIFLRLPISPSLQKC
jgi:hypothetical protein